MSWNGTIPKDAQLDLAATSGANVAQFVSFSPSMKQRFSRIRSYNPNHTFASGELAIAALMKSSAGSSVNIRTFRPDSMQGNPFVFGIQNPAEATKQVESFAEAGWTVLVNETLRVDDGGVSGVAVGNVVEIVPADTPRGVEKEGVVELPREIAFNLLEKVYGPGLALPENATDRVEFSIHTSGVGWRGSRVVIWETQADALGGQVRDTEITWPNKFSQFVGDKAYGLLVAEILGASVPETLVIGRTVPPFQFGRPTNGTDRWMRTCPVTPVPGKFTTARQWLDPYELLRREDPSGGNIQSVLWQAGVTAAFSGGAVLKPGTSAVIEGVAGTGEDFMLGIVAPVKIPRSIADDVERAIGSLAASLGTVRIEWAHDGERPWVIQLHSNSGESRSSLAEGQAQHFVDFDPDDGLEAFRALAVRARDELFGIRLSRPVGLTSHFGDVARKLGVKTVFRR